MRSHCALAVLVILGVGIGCASSPGPDQVAEGKEAIAPDTMPDDNTGEAAVSSEPDQPESTVAPMAEDSPAAGTMLRVMTFNIAHAGTVGLALDKISAAIKDSQPDGPPPWVSPEGFSPRASLPISRSWTIPAETATGSSGNWRRRQAAKTYGSTVVAGRTAHAAA